MEQHRNRGGGAAIGCVPPCLLVLLLGLEPLEQVRRLAYLLRLLLAADHAEARVGSEHGLADGRVGPREGAAERLLGILHERGHVRAQEVLRRLCCDPGRELTMTLPVPIEDSADHDRAQLGSEARVLVLLAETASAALVGERRDGNRADLQRWVHARSARAAEARGLGGRFEEDLRVARAGRGLLLLYLGGRLAAASAHLGGGGGGDGGEGSAAVAAVAAATVVKGRQRWRRRRRRRW
eukprot:scaffold69855_cov69-Phaeocystis_antarctica.AAC.3